jgi:hypothetical protein
MYHIFGSIEQLTSGYVSSVYQRDLVVISRAKLELAAYLATNPRKPRVTREQYQAEESRTQFKKRFTYKKIRTAHSEEEFKSLCHHTKQRNSLIIKWELYFDGVLQGEFDNFRLLKQYIASKLDD